MATKLWSLRVSDSRDASPVAAGQVSRTLSQTVSRLDAFRGGVINSTARVLAGYDQVAASGTLSAASGLGGTDVAGVAINGVDSTVTYGSGGLTTQNLFMAGLRNKVNAGGNTPNALVSKSVYATRTFTAATGTFTLLNATGVLVPEVDGTAISVDFTGLSDAVAAKTLAAAINADGVAGLKVYATASAAVVTMTAQATPRAIVTLASFDAGDVITVTINGISNSTTYDTSDTVTAAALVTLINADTRLNGTVRATSALGVISVISRTAGDLLPAIGCTGTGLTLGGIADPSCTIAVSSASGALVIYVNGVPISLTAVGVNATDAANIVTAINSDPYAKSLVYAKVLSGTTVTISAKSAITLTASVYGTGGSTGTSVVSGGTAAAQGYVLTAAGLYGGIAGNALTLTSAVGVTRSAATLTGGATQVTYTASVPGVAGNWITSAAAGAAAANVTASAARLTSGAETLFPMNFPQ